MLLTVCGQDFFQVTTILITFPIEKLFESIFVENWPSCTLRSSQSASCMSASDHPSSVFWHDFTSKS